ncbi:hypothetical protein Dda_5435 [Drechslerella dactyloides]|uniref:Uncharacterized protein n=1 Tax=Drechslerella dactyloides TaxID=74499 RepID=A0AAD6NIP5_DREDA|nr:hypothetical protein Dda_5435 [Drechslerella dactyloides]
MSEDSRKFILLLGAPTTSSLLSSNERLLSYATPPFEPVPDVSATRIEDYLGTGTLPTISTFDPHSSNQITGIDNDDRENGNAGRQAASSSRLKLVPVPAWRVLPLRKPALHTGFTQRVYDPTPSIYAWKERCFAISMSDKESQNHLEQSSPLVPLSPKTPQLSLEEEDDNDNDHGSSFFLERSYAVHNLPSSQVPPPSSLPPPSRSSASRSQSTADETTYYEEDSVPVPMPPIPIAKITDLEDLPSPAALLNPYKTYFRTLLVGIMKVESRILKTKYQNENNPSGQMELLTFTVGDYTSAGLQVKVWLSLPTGRAAAPTAENPALIPGLARARCFVRGDIVLFQDMVLQNYQGVVYANSVKGKRSKVMLVYREKRGFRVDLSDPVDAAVEKVRRLREWVRGYVGCEGDDELGSGLPTESF